MDRLDQWITPEKLYDSHCHYFGYRTMERFAAQRGYSSVQEFVSNWKFKNMTFDIPPKDPKALADLWAKELEEKGCDKAVLFPEMNTVDELQVAISEYPDRFIPYVMLNPVDDKINAYELLEEAYSKIGIKGFKLYPPLHYYHAYDERIYPYYEFAQDHDILITFHFGISVGQQADIRFMNPADLSPIAREFHKVKFLMAHFATGYLKEMLFLMYHVDNVYAETSSSNAWMKYLPYEINLQQVFQKILNIKGYEKIIFGTDSSFFPRGWRKAIYETQLAVCNHLGLSQDAIDGIFWKNISDMMNL